MNTLLNTKLNIASENNEDTFVGFKESSTKEVSLESIGIKNRNPRFIFIHNNKII